MKDFQTILYFWKNPAAFIPTFYGQEDVYRPPIGRRGPVTFRGTPAEVIQKPRRWQEGP